MDASSYQEGGPVFVLDGGETSGADRWVLQETGRAGLARYTDDEYSLPFLEKGILQILANATGGLSIVLEHRSGECLPVI